MVRHIQANASKEELAKQAEGLSRQAAKQQAILHFLISEPEGVKIPAAELCKKTDTSSATIKTLIQKGLLKESYEEVYRDPYQDKMFKKQSPCR